MIEECPSCHERVIFASDTCPSCGASRKDAPSKVVAAAAVASDEREAKPWEFWLALALICLTIFSFLENWHLVSQSGSIDLRNRITGARLLVEGLDAYHYKWQVGEPIEFCDIYENPNLPITKTTVSPAMLWVTYPLAMFPYDMIRHLWMLAEWLLLGGIWFMWWRQMKSKQAARWLWSGFVVLFTFSLSWRHHIDRGQAYVLWAALLGAWACLSLSPTTLRSWIAGFLAGVLAVLRPPLMMIFAPYMVLKARGQIVAMVLGAVLTFVAPMAWRDGVWQEYGAGMKTWSEVYRGGTEPRPGPRAYPAEIEGVPLDLIGTFQVKKYVDSSIYRLCRVWDLSVQNDKLVLALVLVPFGIWLLWARRLPAEQLLLGLVAWSFITDAFLPAYRNPYNDVMVLNLAALLLLVRKEKYPIAAILLGLSLVFAIQMAWWPQPEKALLYVYSIGFMLAALAVIIRLSISKPKAPVAGEP